MIIKSKDEKAGRRDGEVLLTVQSFNLLILR